MQKCKHEMSNWAKARNHLVDFTPALKGPGNTNTAMY
jgi:hypothetical protein